MEKVKVIEERFKMAESHLKSNTDLRRTSWEFEVDYWVFLKASPINYVIKFCKKEKLSPLHIGPFRISKRDFH